MRAIPMKTVLANTAQEIERLARVANAVDETVADLVAAPGPATPDQVERLQSVDLLRQSLECLGVLMRNLAEAESGETTVAPETAGHGLFLRDLRDACLSAPHAG